MAGAAGAGAVLPLSSLRLFAGELPGRSGEVSGPAKSAMSRLKESSAATLTRLSLHRLENLSDSNHDAKL